MDEEVEPSTRDDRKRKFECIYISDSDSLWSTSTSSDSSEEERKNDEEDDNDDSENILHEEIDDSENILDEEIIDDWMDTAGPREPFPAHDRGVIHINFSENPTPKDIFDYFFPQELIELIVKETNKYANDCIELRQKKGLQKRNSRDKKWTDTNPDEIRILLALIILQGIVVKPTVQMYFSTREIVETPFFNQVMSRDRFLILLSFLHFNNEQKTFQSNSNYDLLQIKPVLDKLLARWQSTYTPERDVCIDESFLMWEEHFKWNSSRVRIKLYMLCESSTGYVYNLMLHAGGDTVIPDRIQDINLEDFDKPGQIVLTLMESLLNLGHRLYVGDFYGSPMLFDALVDKKTDAVGTVTGNREGMPKKMTLQNKLSAYYRKKLMALKWVRSKTMLSTIHDDSMKTYSNTNKRLVTKPKVIFDYKRGMRGVHLLNLCIETFSHRKVMTKIYYKKLFFQLLDIGIFNSFIVYKKCGHNITHLRFRTELVKDIIDQFVNNIIKKKSVNNNNNIIDQSVNNNNNIPRRLLGNHFICRNQNSRSTNYTLRRACVVCSANNVRRDVRYSCRQCKVALCAVPCFEIFHTQKHF
ncbi:piggyBac transposable element-derived protein 4-like [Centruroides sculpturatus]|uniref:piggyBac transposable element-derived protein 4-like n=1 Tax=Centruroides sculpturatus TaxID=218467 RepID=UPI000C6EF30D|nr:piggyBac transposable element-derived protein 4-like [Centruroides sculpturatus]